MPPSEQLEEIGALATLIDENRFAYSLDALCAWRGLPGKDTSIAGGGDQGRRLRDQQAEPDCKHTSGKCRRTVVGPYAEADPIATLGLFEKPRSDPRSRGHPRRLSSRRRSAADGARDAPPRHPHRSECGRTGARAMPAETRRRARRAVGAARHADRAWPKSHRQNGRRRTFDAHHINYPRTEKGNPSFKAGKLGLDGDASALAAAADRHRQQI